MFNLSQTQAYILILIAAAIWGSTFVAQQIAMQYLDVYVYTAMRFLVGSLTILPLVIWETKQLNQKKTNLVNKTIFWKKVKKLLPACGLGLILFFGMITQQTGIKYTSVTNSGFLTAIYVPVVPILAWLIYKKSPTLLVVVSAVLSSVGIVFIAGGEITNLNSGDIWVLISVIFWALHVLFVGVVAIKVGAPIRVAFTQFMVCGVLSLIIGMIVEGISLQLIWQAMPTILWGGVLSVGIGFTLQVIAQQHTKPAITAIILSSEFIFASLSAVIYLGDKLTLMQILGGVIIMVSILLVQIKR